MSDYRPRHSSTTDPVSLPLILRGLADLVQVIEEDEK